MNARQQVAFCQWRYCSSDSTLFCDGWLAGSIALWHRYENPGDRGNSRNSVPNPPAMLASMALGRLGHRGCLTLPRLNLARRKRSIHEVSPVLHRRSTGSTSSSSRDTASSRPARSPDIGFGSFANHTFLSLQPSPEGVSDRWARRFPRHTQSRNWRN